MGAVSGGSKATTAAGTATEGWEGEMEGAGLRLRGTVLRGSAEWTARRELMMWMAEWLLMVKGPCWGLLERVMIQLVGHEGLKVGIGGGNW